MQQEAVVLESRENVATTPARSGARDESGRWRFRIMHLLSLTSMAINSVKLRVKSKSGCSNMTYTCIYI